MNIRELRPSDLPRLKAIASRYSFPFPDLTNPLYFGKGVASVGQRLVGAGFLKLTAEAILLLDYESTKREKCEALNSLILTGQAVSKKLGIENWHIFIKDQPSFEDVLIKHYGFSDCKEHSGNALHLLIGA